ncbi:MULTISPECIES: DUF4153 domain-containing protein [unclassified Fusibacter]|uniref:DUF4153 domain-containing protein n=1 Tax=unclassified Fusibacter TaxID=2624464 RepID=UPI00101180A6|nr:MULTISPECIES: DUF4153 domain-containing protein [unclassified Fusibacter]MCK8060094.1 DUF4153 domain-containing protein [Fusibacter sp. A2]NPE22236.1 DUF4153 domain-containing protein [Fusibacter sp. A1]RXV61010.1 DUF4153 domain-containing protein [Fusibacter sp. A1]
MSTFTQSVTQIFKNAFNALKTFPASILFAVAFSLVTMIRIQLDWPEQESYNFLFNCLHWTFAFAAVLSLATVTAAQSRHTTKKTLVAANALTVVTAMIVFLSLYFLGGTDTEQINLRFDVLSRLAIARISIMTFVSLLAFILLAATPKEQSDFSQSLFMTQKSLFIAMIYGGVIASGTSAVAAAIENLLYSDMSEKVYMYLATLSGLLAYTIFVGYFPDFRKNVVDSRHESVQRQPQFIEILFQYIMIPIVLALTAVLLLWTARTLITGSWPVFIQLSSIATSYAIGGIWLHIMVTHHKSKIAAFYRRVFPMTALVILAFEAWALLVQLSKFGLKTTEYYFTLIWIVSAAAAVLLILYKAKTHAMIVILVCCASIISVLPLAGYHSLPVFSQVNRLENLLVAEGILKDDQLSPASDDIDLSVRESITDSVVYLAHTQTAKLPEWFDRKLGEDVFFKNKLGFEQTWPKELDYDGREGYLGLYVESSPDVIDISGYEWASMLQNQYLRGKAIASLETEKGTYEIYWTTDRSDGVPSLKITLDDTLILEQDMNAFIDKLIETYPLGQRTPKYANPEAMSYLIENETLKILVVFTSVEVNIDPRNDNINYWLNAHALYLHEK